MEYSAMENSGSMGPVELILSIGIYVFFCFCIKKICEKVNYDPGILVWIPIANMVPLLKVAGLSPLWLIGYFIPLVNLGVMIYHWAKVCIALNESPWLVIAMFIPILNLGFILYLAFSAPKTGGAAAA